MFDVRLLLAEDCIGYGVKLKVPNIAHEIVGCSVFSGYPFGAGAKEGYHCWTLVYSNLTTTLQIRKNYGDGVMSLTEG